MKRETIKVGDYEMNVVVTDALPDGVSMMLVGQPDPDAEDALASMARRSVVLRDTATTAAQRPAEGGNPTAL